MLYLLYLHLIVLMSILRYLLISAPPGYGRRRNCGDCSGGGAQIGNHPAQLLPMVLDSIFGRKHKGKRCST